MVEKAPDIGAIGATVLFGAAVESIWHLIGVAFIGGLGGAFWALMQIEKTQGWSRSLGFISARTVLAFFLTWMPALWLQAWLAEHDYKVAITIVMGTLAFIIGSYKELLTEITPLIKVASRFKLMFKPTKEE